MLVTFAIVISSTFHRPTDSSGTNIEDEKKADANADGNKGDDDDENKTSDDAIVVVDGKEVDVIDGADVAIKEDGAAPDNEGEEIAALMPKTAKTMLMIMPTIKMSLATWSPP